jgi:hypothetical protein
MNLPPFLSKKPYRERNIALASGSGFRRAQSGPIAARDTAPGNGEKSGFLSIPKNPPFQGMCMFPAQFYDLKMGKSTKF